MPRARRYFPVSHEILTDPDFQMLVDEFGMRFWPFWMFCLRELDRHENSLKLDRRSLEHVSKLVRSRTEPVRKMIRRCVEEGFLCIRSQTEDGFPTDLYSPNYWKYHKTQVHDGEPSRNTLGSPPNLPNLPNLPNKDILSGKPDDTQLKNGHNGHEAEALIEFLNQKTGKTFKAKNPNGEPTSTLRLVQALLKKGYSKMQVQQVIANRFREWSSNPDMAKYLRPATLFRLSNFENYVGELKT